MGKKKGAMKRSPSLTQERIDAARDEELWLKEHPQPPVVHDPNGIAEPPFSEDVASASEPVNEREEDMKIAAEEERKLLDRLDREEGTGMVQDDLADLSASLVASHPDEIDARIAAEKASYKAKMAALRTERKRSVSIVQVSHLDTVLNALANTLPEVVNHESGRILKYLQIRVAGEWNPMMKKYTFFSKVSVRTVRPISVVQEPTPISLEAEIDATLRKLPESVHG